MNYKNQLAGNFDNGVSSIHASVFQDFLQRSNATLRALGEDGEKFLNDYLALKPTEIHDESCKSNGYYKPETHIMRLHPRLLADPILFTAIRAHEMTHALQFQKSAAMCLPFNKNSDIAFLPEDVWKICVRMEQDAYAKQALIAYSHAQDFPEDIVTSTISREGYTAACDFKKTLEGGGDVSAVMKRYLEEHRRSVISAIHPDYYFPLAQYKFKNFKSPTIVRLTDDDINVIGDSWGQNFFKGQHVPDIVQAPLKYSDLNEAVIDHFHLDVEGLPTLGEVMQQRGLQLSDISPRCSELEREELDPAYDKGLT